MTKPVKKPTKALQDNKRKPTAQELHQQTSRTPPVGNPTNAGTNNPDAPPNSGAGYSTPDAPGEGDESVASLDNTIIGGDKELPPQTPKEIPQPSPPQETPVEDNPKM